MKEEKVRSRLKKKESVVADIDMDIKKIEAKDKSEENFQYFNQEMDIQTEEIQSFRKKKLGEEAVEF